MNPLNVAIDFGNVQLPWSAIMLVLGLLVGVVTSHILIRKKGLYRDLALDACILFIPSGLIGARLFALLSGKIELADFFRFSVLGLNLFGAVLFCLLAFWIYCRIKKFQFLQALDVLTPGIFFGFAVGRWSDFFLCEGLGNIVKAGIPKFFPLCTFTEAYFSDGKTVAYAIFFLDFLLCSALAVFAFVEVLKRETFRGEIFLWSSILFCSAELLLEFLRDGEFRQIVFGTIRFNQILWFLALILLLPVCFMVLRRKVSDAVPEGSCADAFDEDHSAHTEAIPISDGNPHTDCDADTNENFVETEEEI